MIGLIRLDVKHQKESESGRRWQSQVPAALPALIQRYLRYLPAPSDCSSPRQVRSVSQDTWLPGRACVHFLVSFQKQHISCRAVSFCACSGVAAVRSEGARSFLPFTHANWSASVPRAVNRISQSHVLRFLYFSTVTSISGW